MTAAIPLTDDEQAAVEDGQAAIDRLLGKLADTPTPAGPTPRQLAAPGTGRLLPVIDVRHGETGQNRTNLFHRKIKMIKRQMYGRAGFDLLRKRVILAPCVTAITKFAAEPNYVSEGLEHPFEWYITETVIYHQPKVTRQGPPRPASRRRIAAAPPGRMTSPST